MEAICLETVLNRKKIVKLNEEFIKNYNEDSDKRLLK